MATLAMYILTNSGTMSLKDHADAGNINKDKLARTRHVVLSANSADVRVSWAPELPTASGGHPVAQGETIVVDGPQKAQALKVNGAATITITLEE